MLGIVLGKILGYKYLNKDSTQRGINESLYMSVDHASHRQFKSIML